MEIPDGYAERHPERKYEIDHTFLPREGPYKLATPSK